MNRKEFVAASGAMTMAAGVMAGRAEAKAGGEKPMYYELREYQMLPGGKKKLLGDFVKDVEVPALNRLGIEPVGVFTGLFGGESLSMYMLAPHKSLDSFATLPSRLAADAKYLSDGASVLDAPADDPVYVRFENSLLVAFDGMPAVDIPTKSSSRVFELRTYESHSRKFGKKKIEMFNTAEIDVFLKTGLHPVFFGESIVGPNLPNLVYMLAFEEMAQREKAWDVFGSSPEWKELRSRPEFAGTVSNINVKILKPTGYSQI